MRHYVDSNIATPLPTHNLSISERWQEWIYNESRQRLAVIFRTLTLLIHFDPTKMCNLQTDLFVAPLPAKRQLWEATNAHTWKVESERHVDYGLASTGDLVEMRRGQSWCGSEVLMYDSVEGEGRGWDEWCGGMDGFGGLVLLAASMVG